MFARLLRNFTSISETLHNGRLMKKENNDWASHWRIIAEKLNCRLTITKPLGKQKRAEKLFHLHAFKQLCTSNLDKSCIS